MPPRMLAEFAAADDALGAARLLRAHGCLLDLYAPFAVPGAAEAIAAPPSRVPLVTLLGGIAGAAAAYVLQWWCTSVDYPLRSGAFPAHPVPAFIPITFESLVLGACLGAFIAAFAASGLPRLWHPAFEIDGFERSEIDRFFVEIAGADAPIDAMRDRLASFGVLRVVALEEE